MHMFTGDLDRAILETLAYSDIFEYPLRMEELHRYLPVHVDREELPIRLRSLTGQVGETDGFYFLSEHNDFVSIRKQRDIKSRMLMPHALRYGRILGSMPFIRMVSLTGSLAVLNVSKNIDFDYLLVTIPGKVWTARAFALLFNRLTRLMGHTICPNLVISESSLEWHQRDLYSAHEFCQMIPIAGMDVYQRMIKANEWVKHFLPNAILESNSFPSKSPKHASDIQSVLEFPLRGKLGSQLESWEMNRKITRFSKREGLGKETIFNAEMCQGNFDHHRTRTQKMFKEKRKRIIGIDVKQKEVISGLLSEIASSPIGSSQ